MIAELLKTGCESPTTASELAEKLHINRRTVYARIARERATGALIIGCNDGFYLAENQNDLEYYAARSRSRGAKTIAAGTAARKELKKTKGQAVLFPTTEATQPAPETNTAKP